MNQYKALDLLKHLGLKELHFKKSLQYETIEPEDPILFSNELYFCKDRSEYEEICNNYPWEVVAIACLYDPDVNVVLIEFTAWSTDSSEYEKLDWVYAIVKRDFLNANNIKVIIDDD